MTAKEHLAEKMELSPAIMEFIEKWRDKPGNLIMILHKIQEEYDFVPRAAALRLTEVINVPLAKIYGVLTFYHLFKLKKPGEHQIQVCMGTACYLKGSEDLINELETLLGISINQTTKDGKFSLEAVRCIGCCGLAPVITINGETFSNLTKDQLPAILAKFK